MDTVKKTKSSTSLIWGAVLIVLGVLSLFNRAFSGMDEVIGGIIMGGIGLTFAAIFSANRVRNRWAMIPAYIFGVIGGLIFLSSFVSDDLIGIAIMLAIAAPFVMVYRRNRMQKWALIPAYVLTAMTVPIALDGVLNDDLLGAYILYAIAAPFAYVYLKNRSKKWALIPAGIMGAVGTIMLVSGMRWLLPVALIGAGAYLMLAQRDRKERRSASTSAYTRPKTGPEADRPLTDFVPLGGKDSAAEVERTLN